MKDACEKGERTFLLIIKRSLLELVLEVVIVFEYDAKLEKKSYPNPIYKFKSSSIILQLNTLRYASSIVAISNNSI